MDRLAPTSLPPDLVISHGSHTSFRQGSCALEWVDFLDRSRRGTLRLGDRPTDAPACVSPSLRAAIVAWNDSLPSDAERTRLLGPLVPELLDTVSSPEVEKIRSYMAVDWMVRTFTPTWLDLGGLGEHAEKIRNLGEIRTLEDLQATDPILSAAESAARNAAESAARNAAYNAAYNAARRAAYNAARNAAESAARNAAESAARNAADSAAYNAARSAAESAAYNAARSAARNAADSAAESAAESAAYSAARNAAESAARNAADSAAYSAARNAAESAARNAADSAAYNALAPTVVLLQDSFLTLVRRMIGAGGAA